MKTLKESLLGNTEDALSNDYMLVDKEFKQLHKEVSSGRNFNKAYGSSANRKHIRLNLPNLCKLLNYNADSIEIDLVDFTKTNDYSWIVEIRLLGNGKCVYFANFYVSADDNKHRTLSSFAKNFWSVATTDVETFRKFLDNAKNWKENNKTTYGYKSVLSVQQLIK